MGISWEFRGNLMGIFGADNQEVNRFRGNLVGIWWEFGGNLMGIWWEFDGNLREFEGNIKKSLKLNRKKFENQKIHTDFC